MAEILLLDDAEPYRRMLSYILREEGHLVTESGDGAASYDSELIAKIDIMITDIDMPRINGIEAILIAQKKRPDLKIIAISGAGTDSVDDYLNACGDLRVSHIMRKPFEPDAMIKTVRSVLAA